MFEDRTAHLSARIEPSLKNELQRYCDSKHQNRSDVVRRALLDFLHRNAPQVPPAKDTGK